VDCADPQACAIQPPIHHVCDATATALDRISLAELADGRASDALAVLLAVATETA
jgi:DNA-binding IscR family transcriptional regulator